MKNVVTGKMDMTRALGTLSLRAAGCAFAAVTLFLTACSSTSLTKNCCYTGDAALVHIDKVEFVAADGSVSTFADIYPGYSPEDKFVTTPFPFRKVTNSRVTYDSLVIVLDLYDANKNGFLEEPEITVLYLREGALGMGHKVDHLAVDGKRVDAITTSASDVGGLMRYLNARMDSLTPEVQMIFSDMHRVGQDIKLSGSERGNDRKIKVK